MALSFSYCVPFISTCTARGVSSTPTPLPHLGLLIEFSGAELALAFDGLKFVLQAVHMIQRMCKQATRNCQLQGDRKESSGPQAGNSSLCCLNSRGKLL